MWRGLFGLPEKYIIWRHFITMMMNVVVSWKNWTNCLVIQQELKKMLQDIKQWV